MWARLGTIGDSVVVNSTGRGATVGIRNAGGSSVSRQIFLSGFYDRVLGVGTNPIL